MEREEGEVQERGGEEGEGAGGRGMIRRGVNRMMRRREQ